MKKHPAASTCLSDDCRALLHLLDRLTGTHLDNVQLLLQDREEAPLLVSARREQVVRRGQPTTWQLTGYVAPWNGEAEGWDHFRPLLVFSSANVLFAWLSTRFA